MLKIKYAEGNKKENTMDGQTTKLTKAADWDIISSWLLVWVLVRFIMLRAIKIMSKWEKVKAEQQEYLDCLEMLVEVVSEVLRAPMDSTSEVLRDNRDLAVLLSKVKRKTGVEIN